MKNLYIILSILFIFNIYSCKNTLIDDIDVDFEIESPADATGYVGKPIPLSFEITRVDKNNTYPIEVKISSKKGKVEATDEQLLKDVFQMVDNDIVKINYTPTEQGEEKLILTFKNVLIQKEVTVFVNVKDDLYSVIAENQPERSLIDTPFDFDLMIRESENTGAESITTYAKVVKGTGSVFNGEIQLNNEDEETKSRLVVGKNKISYTGNVEGENIIRFFFVNKWGNELIKDVPLNISLPLWELSNSMGEEAVEIPFNDKFSFNLSVDEEDIFKDNSYIGTFRILTNSTLKLSINDKEYNQGAEFKLKAGGNVGLLTVNDATEGSIEFIIKDKYKQEKKNTIHFVPKLPVKPIEASLDKLSQTVKINEPTIFKLSLKETNYNDVFSVKYDILSGEGIFEGGNEHSLSEGTHQIRFTPTQAGANTFKITIKDTNEQEKILNATVQATLSALTVNLSETTFELIQGQTKSIKLSASVVDYKGKYFLSYTSDLGGALNVNGTNIGIGGIAEFSANEIPIIVSSSVMGLNTYTITIKDEYQQAKDVALKVTVKGEIRLTAQTGGTVSGGGIFAKGQSTTITGTPNVGYSFMGWYIGDILINPLSPFTFPVTQSITYEARFSAQQYVLTVDNEAGGSVTGAGKYAHGAKATLKATPDTGFKFDGWYIGTTKVSSAPEYLHTVTKNETIVGKFIGNEYTLTVNAGTGGTVTGGGKYNHGKEVTVKATLDPDYQFEGWFINNALVSASLEYKFIIKAETVIEARFKGRQLSVTVNAITGGTASGSGNYDFGTSVTVKATVLANYAFEGWFKDDKLVSSSLEYSFILKENTILEARFKGNPYNVTVNTQEGGTVTGSGSYEYGSKAKVVATAKPNFAFTGWYEGATKVSTSLSYEFTVTKNVVLEARFEGNKLNVTVNAQAGGTATGSGVFEYNTNVTVKAVPDINHTFKGWHDGAKIVSTALDYTFILKEAAVLEAQFTAKKYQITVNAQEGGTASGSGSFEYKSKTTIIAKANVGYKFSGWYLSNIFVSNIADLEIEVLANSTFEARFEANKHTISVSAETGGTVTGSGTYEYGKTVSLVAKADANYTFDGWYEGAVKVSANSTYAFTIDKNRTLVAKFKGNPFNVTVNTQEGGTVTGSGSFEYGSKVKIVATTKPNYSFTGWYEGNTLVSSSLTYEFTLTKSTTLEARFSAQKMNVTVNAQAGGTAIGSGSFDYNSNVTVKATVLIGHTFTGWHDGTKIVSTSLDYTFVLAATIVLEARFEANTYNIVVNAQTGGTATGSNKYKYGVNATLVATAATGYKFIGWYSGSSQLSTTPSYSFKVEKDLNIEARFEANKYNIIANAETGGSVTGSGSFAYGSNVTLKATATTNYVFDAWYEGATKVSANLSYTFIVEKERTLVAKFIINKHKVTLSGVNGTQTGSGEFEYGSNATIEAKPNTNYKFLGWYTGTTKVSESNPYTFKVEKDVIYEAKFELVKYIISATASTGGTVSGSGTYNHGADVTLKATAQTGYKFIGWYEDEKQVSTSATYTFKVDKERTIQAKFELVKYIISATASTGGTVSGSGTYNHGADVTLKATAQTGYKFIGWYEGNTLIIANTPFIFKAEKEKAFVAMFEAVNVVYTVSSNKDHLGVTNTTGGTVNYGDVIKLDATLHADATYYVFAGWYEGNTRLSLEKAYSFTATKNIHITAKFAKKVFLGHIFALLAGEIQTFRCNSELIATAKVGADMTITGLSTYTYDGTINPPRVFLSEALNIRYRLVETIRTPLCSPETKYTNPTYINFNYTANSSTQTLSYKASREYVTTVTLEWHKDDVKQYQYRLFNNDEYCLMPITDHVARTFSM